VLLENDVSLKNKLIFNANRTFIRRRVFRNRNIKKSLNLNNHSLTSDEKNPNNSEIVKLSDLIDISKEMMDDMFHIVSHLINQDYLVRKGIEVKQLVSSNSLNFKNFEVEGNCKFYLGIYRFFSAYSISQKLQTKDIKSFLNTKKSLDKPLETKKTKKDKKDISVSIIHNENSLKNKKDIEVNSSIFSPQKNNNQPLDQYNLFDFRGRMFLRIAFILKLSLLRAIKLLEFYFMKQIKEVEKELQEEINEKKKKEFIRYSAENASFAGYLPPLKSLISIDISSSTNMITASSTYSFHFSSNSSILSSISSSVPVIFFTSCQNLVFSSFMLSVKHDSLFFHTPFISKMIKSFGDSKEKLKKDIISTSFKGSENNLNKNSEYFDTYFINEKNTALLRVIRNVLYVLRRINDNDESGIPLNPEIIKDVEDYNDLYIKKFIGYSFGENDSSNEIKNKFVYENEDDYNYLDQFYHCEYESDDLEEISNDSSLLSIAFHVENIFFNLGSKNCHSIEYKKNYFSFKEKMEDSNNFLFKLKIFLSYFDGFLFLFSIIFTYSFKKRVFGKF
jgi:hypothetical protein